MRSETRGNEKADTKPVAALPEALCDHIGQLLREVYSVGELTELSPSLRGLLDSLSEGLAEQADADAEIFRAAMMNAVPSLRAFAIRLCGRREEADDLVQETLLRGWQHRSSFVPGTKLEAWLFTILRNYFYTVCRKRAREVEDGTGQYAASLAVAPHQDRGLRLREIQSALDELSPEMRETLVLVGVQEISYDQVAVITGVALGTVKSRVWRARTRLAQLLGYDFEDIRDEPIIHASRAGSRVL